MKQSQIKDRVDILIIQREKLLCHINYDIDAGGNRDVTVKLEDDTDVLFCIEQLNRARSTLGYKEWKDSRPADRILANYNPDKGEQEHPF